MIEAETLYDAHRTAFFEFTGTWLPFWRELSGRERDQWAATSHEVNAKDRKEIY